MNNGVLLLIAKDDRAFRIEVGYGLEGAITDDYAGSVADFGDLLLPEDAT
mgnify:FL=1